ncbi:hypothetical protein ACP70R_033672 [Stipagrostis hirtigluma subsp. patula]
MDSDDDLSIFSDDHIDDDEFDMSSNGVSKNDCCDDAVVNEAIFELFKKHANKENKVKSDFSRLFRKPFIDVLSGLAIDQTGVIERFGFGSLLKFVKCTVPKAFVKWISSCIDVRTSELILKGRVIHFSKLSVHKILGLPVGGAALFHDSIVGKDFLLSKFNVEKIDSMDFFVDKLVGAHDLSDDEVFTCFMIVAISCFLCPDSSYQHLIDLIHVFQDPTRVRNFDWSLLLYELVLAYVTKMQRQKFVSSNGHHVTNACSYFLTISDKFKEPQSIGEDYLVDVDVATDYPVENRILSSRKVEEDMKIGLENLVDHLDLIPSTKSLCSNDGVLGESDLALKIGYSCEKARPSVVSNGMKMNDNHDQSGLEVNVLLLIRSNMLYQMQIHLLHQLYSQRSILKKGQFSKLSMLDLNEIASVSVIASQKLCTPDDKFIDVDSNLPIPQFSVPNCCKVAEFDFAKDIPENSKLVPKEKFLSKSANFLSKLQIGDLNVPLVQTEDLSPTADFINACGVAPISIISVPDNNAEGNFVVKEKEHIGLINLVNEFDNHNNDDVQFIHEVNFQSKSRDLCNQCDIIYDQNIVGASKSVNAEFQEPSVCKPQSWSSKFVLSKQEKLNYIDACRLATNSKMKDQNALDIGKCYVKYSELGNSLRTGCKVGSFVINALCRKFFLDKRPTISKKHYFFSSVRAILLNGHGSISYVQKCFDGAVSILPLHKADMLLFPICYDDHWFLFIVDIKNHLFVILDSYYSEDDGYQIYVRSQLIPNFKKIWSELVHGPLDFENFDVAYPPVPKQNNLTDCGVFVIMFLTDWTWYCGLCIDFFQDDIDNIRIHTVSSLLCSEHNIVNISLVTNYFQQGSFPQFGQIRKGTTKN